MTPQELVDFMDKYPNFDSEKYLEMEKKDREYANSKECKDKGLIVRWVLRLSDMRKVYRRGYRIKLRVFAVNNLVRQLSDEESDRIVKMFLRMGFDRIERLNVEFETIQHFEELEFVWKVEE